MLDGMATDSQAAPYHKIRDLSSVTNTSHLSTEAYDLLTPVDSIFAAQNSSCFLLAQYTEGPFYVSGEKIRSDIREDQPGVDLVLDLEFVDATTCEPVIDAYIEIFHGQSFGVLPIPFLPQ